MTEYIAAMEAAEASRVFPTEDRKHRHPTGLDIYNMKEQKCRGRKETLNKCLEQERKGWTGVAPGTSAWIDTGLRIQEDQIAVTGLVSRLSRLKRSPTGTELLDLAQRRSKLSKAIDKFLADIPVYLPRSSGTAHRDKDLDTDDEPEDENEDVDDAGIAGDVEDPLHEGRDNGLLDGEQEDNHKPEHNWEDATVADDGEGSEWRDQLEPKIHRDLNPSGGVVPPERTALPLPTRFSEQSRAAHGWEKQVAVELYLREGRLRDFLARLREAIAFKAFTWSRDWKNARGQTMKTRSLKRLQRLDRDVRRESNAYDRCRALYFAAGGTLKNEFSELTPEHVQGVRSFVDHAMRGKSKNTASWIWSGGLSEEGYVRERECYASISH